MDIQIPCRDCICLATCRSQMIDNIKNKTGTLYELYKKCSHLRQMNPGVLSDSKTYIMVINYLYGGIIINSEGELLEVM